MNLEEARKRIPELNGLSDESAVNVIHEVYYPDMDKAALAGRLGYKMAPPPAPERSAARAVGDLGLQFAGGAVSGVRMMADIAGADNKVSGTLRTAEEALREWQSAAAKADQARVAEILKEAEDKGFGDQVMAGIRAFGVAPGAMMAQAAGTSLPTLATAAIPGVGPAAVAARLGTAGVMGAVQGAGNIKGVIYEDVKRALIAEGKFTPEEIEAKAVEAQSYGGENAGQIALGGTLGAAAGSTGMERTVAALRGGVSTAAPGILARVGTGALTEAVPEMAQGGQEKYASNLALGNEGFVVDPLSGVVTGATVEGLAGGVMGGALGIPNPSVVGSEPPVNPAAPPPNGPLSRAAQKAPAPVAPPPAPAAPAPDQAAALLAFANERAQQIEEKAKGTKDQKIDGPDGKPMTVPGRKPEFLTPEEKAEREFLQANGGDATALAQVYPELVASLPPAQPVGASLTGADPASMLAAPENPLVESGRALVADRASEKRVNAALTRMERDAGRDMAVLREWDAPAAPAESPAAQAPAARAPLPTMQPGDILNKEELPFKNRLAASNVQKKQGGELVEVFGGWVVRPAAAQQPTQATPDVTPEAAQPAALVDTPAAADAAGFDAVPPAQAQPQGALSDGQAQEESAGRPVPAAAAQAAAVEAPAPAGGDGAVTPAVVPAAPGAGGVEAAGVAGDGLDRIYKAKNRQEFEDGWHALADSLPNGATVYDPETEETYALTKKTSKAGNSSSTFMGSSPANLFMLDTKADGSRTVGGALPTDKSLRITLPTETPAAAKKPPYVSKEEGERLFGVDVKRQAAIDRIAKGTAYFGTPEKARDFITKSGIKDTHEAVTVKPGRVEVRAKAGAITPPNQAANPGEDGEITPPKETAIDRRNRLIAERTEQPAADDSKARKSVQVAPNGIKVGDRVRVTSKPYMSGDRQMNAGAPDREATVTEIEVNAPPAYGGVAFKVAADDSTPDGRGTSWVGVDAVSPVAAPAPAAAKSDGGPFGPILTRYRGDAQGAIKALTQLQDGEAVAALNHPDVGDIDLVWGEAPGGKREGFGLAKIVMKHPEVLADLQGFISSLTKDEKRSGSNRIRLVDSKGEAVVSLDWKGDRKVWLLTAYEKGAEAGTTMDTASNGSKGDTARLGPDANSSVTAPQVDAKPKKPKAIADRDAKVLAARADYFTPGNIVQGYSGFDEVLAYEATEGGGFKVTVHEVKKVGDEWHRVGKPQDRRQHSTLPESRQIAAGPVARLGYTPAAEVVYTSPRSDGQPFPNAVDRGTAPAAPASEIDAPWSDNEEKSLMALIGRNGGVTTKDMGGHFYAEVSISNNDTKGERARGATSLSAKRALLKKLSTEATGKAPEVVVDKAEIRPFRRADGSIGYEAVPIRAAAPAPAPEAVVKVPPAVTEAMTGQMQKQKNRIARLKREAEAAGMSLDEKKQAQTKVLAAEATLRKMRTSVFDAEDAAVKAVETKDASAFAVHADLFPDADAAIKVLLGQNDELDAEMQGLEDGLSANTRAEDKKKVAAATPSATPLAQGVAPPAAAAKPDPLTEQEKAAKAKMLNAAGKLAALLSKNTRASITPEQEQQMLPIVIELFEGAMDLGYVKFKQAARYVREFIANAIDQEAADSIPIDTLQGAYIATSRRHKDKDITPKGEVVTIESVAELEEPAEQADTEDEGNGNATQQLDRPSAGALEGTPAQDVRSPDQGRDAGQGPDGSGRGNVAGDAGPDGAGRDLAGGMGADAGALPVPGRGARASATDAKKPRVPRTPRTDAGDGLFGTAAGGLTPDAGANPAPNAPAIPAPQPAAQDFTITDEFELGEGGQKTKFKNNVAAIRLLRDLESTGRMATPDEQKVLAKYVGWGGLSQAFDGDKADWAKEHAEITALMSPEELDAATKSTRYAHYTSREIVQDGIYAALRHFGFTGGKTLEAGAGVGNFIGLMPADMRSAGRFTAIEREPFSSAIARQLYPQQSVQRADFTEFKGNDAYFDAAVGNPPFASDPQTDASGRKHLSGLSLHNYFFAKAVDMLREGGIMAQVVTNSFLDAKGDKARRYISDRVELLGAIRLPNSAFSKNANTEVTTDLIFFKKRPDSEVGGKAARADAKRWLDAGIYTDAQGKRVALNQYFIDNPSMMLGDFGAFGTMYGPDQPALVAKPGQDTLALLKEAVGKLPAGVYKSIAETGTENIVNAAIVALKNPSVKEGGYFVDGAKLMQRLPDIAGEARGTEVTPATQWTAKTTLGQSGFDRIKALANMRGTVRSLLAAEMADDSTAMTEQRKTLNEQYDAFQAEHGFINDPGTLRVFEDDPDFPLLASLEHGYTPGIGPVAAKRLGVKPTKPTAKKGPIFTQRVVAARQAVQKVDSPADALAVSMAERGKLDAAYIGKLLGKAPEEVLGELSGGDKPLLFRDPVTDEYVLRDAYLSGNVRAKLVQAKEAGMFANITALEAVQPEDVASHEIVARLGSPWVPVSVYQDFAQSLYGEESKATITYLAANSSYQLTVQNGDDVALTNTWGTKEYAGDDLLQAVMNNRSIKVTYTDRDGKTHTVVDATERANEKATEIKARFSDWIFSDPDRSELLTKAYNETNNNYVTRVYDGASMTFPGKVPDTIIKFRRHQRNAIARIVQDRTALLDHVVGAGKTFTVIAGAMELKRTGLARKPMVAVPNHLVKQWAADFYRLYPGANVLTATKKDFEKANRRKFLAKIATGDWDAVVIAHSSYGFIRPAPEFEAEFNGREIAKIMATMKEVEQGDGDKQVKKRTVKQLAGMKERLENRIKALRDKPMDDLLDFEQIGVDQLFVDEAHMFKNLMYSTKMQGVAGLNDPTGSQRAYDMYVKTNQVMEKNGRGQGVVFATGTPVSNSLAEMYHMMRYLMPTQMRELGFESFDAWANTYASVEQVWMQAPSGDGFKVQNRMSNFVNTPELLKMFDQVSDTVTMDDIKTAYSEENDGAEFPLPKLKGGRRTPVSLIKSKAQDAYMEQIAARAKAIEQRKGPPQKGEDNILVVMSDARKAAMDIRLVDPDVQTRHPGGRIDRATDEVLARYKQFDAVKGTQLVFSDLGTPLKQAKKEMAEYEALQLRIQAGSEDVAVSATLGDEAAMGIMEDAEAAQAELDAMGADWLSAVKSALRGFSIYDDFKAALIEKGVPEAEIAFIHDFNTDDQKASLFRKVNAGQIRVVLGSTAKMGAGTNVQERLVAEHHLDVPWRPSDVEQREGRIERQGNLFATPPTEDKPNPHFIPGFEIEILAYVTQDTLDMRMWQVQETKLKMINQLRTRKIGREIDNAFEDMELSAGEMQAAATGDINLLKEIQLRNDVKKLEQRRRAFEGQRNDLISRKRRNADALGYLPGKLAAAETEATFAAQYRTDLLENLPPFAMNIDGKDYTDAKEAQAVLLELDERTVETTALNGETSTKKAPLSVTINGELIKNRATMAELFSDARGDFIPIAWEFGGQTYRRRTVLATGIRSRVLDAIADESVQQVGTIGAYAVAVEGSSDRNGNPMIEVTMRRGGEVVMSNTLNSSDSGSVPGRVVTVTENMLESAVREAGYLSSQLTRAKKEAAELAKVEVSGAWPDEGKLEAARAAHKEILAKLKQKGAPAAAAQAPEPAPAEPDGSTNLRQTGAPEANTTDTVFNRIDEPAGGADTARDDSLNPESDAARNIGVLDGAIARDTGIPAGVVRSLRPYEARRLSGDEGLRQIAGTFGSRLQGFALRPGLLAEQVEKYGYFNGVRTGGVVFIAAEGNTRPHLAILGHELGHELRTNRPDLYDKMVQAIRPYVDQKNYSDKFLKSSVARNAGNLDKQREEFIGEVLSDGFMDRDFWRALGNKSPSLLRQIGGVVMDLVESVLKSVGYTRKTEAYLTDYKAVMKIAGEVMAEYGGKGAKTGDTAFNAKDDAPNDPRAMVAQAREVVTDLFNTPGKLNWWHKSVGTQYNLAQRSPAFKRVFDRVQDFLGDVSYHATEAAQLAPKILPKLDTWRDIFRTPLSPEDNKAIAAPIFEGTLAWRRDESGAPVKMTDVEAAAGDLTTEQKAQRLLRGDRITERTLRMWRGLPLEQYEAIIEGKFEREMLAAGIVWKDAELVSIFNLTPEQIALYREFRAATDKSLSTLAISDMLRFGGADTAALRDEAMQAEDANVAAVLLRDHLLEMADRDDDRREVLIDTANKMIEKADKVQGLIDRGYAPLSRFGQYSLDVVDESGERVYFGLFESKAEANKMARAMRANFEGATIRQGTMSQEAYKLFAGVSPETLELFGTMLGLEADGTGAKDKAFQEYLKLAKGNRSAMKRLIQRKGVAGFSEDAGRVLAGFIYSNARQTASSLHMGEMAEAANDIPNQQGELKDAALKLIDYIKNPVEEASKLRGLLFAQYLGGSIASAMVNMLQPVQVTLPYLTQFGGVRAASVQMKNALVDVLKKSTGDAELDAALKQAEEEGIVAPQEVHQLMAQAQGSGTLRPGDGTALGNARAKAGNAVAKASLAWGKAFGAAEQFNRRLTFIASYRLAKEQGIPNPAKFAEKTIAETQFVYNKGNKPRWARGAVGGTLFTFKQYSIAYMELLARMAASGPEGKRAALMAVGVLFLMAGSGGLPFVEDIEDVVDGLMTRLGYNFSLKQKRKELLADAFGEEAGRFMEQGISGLPGSPIDVSGRLGLGNLIPGTGLFLKKDDFSRDIVDAVGPAGDLVRRGFQSANALAGGEVGKAAELLFPVAARNLTKAVDMANTGMYRDDRGRKVLDTDGYDALAKAIGFQPGDVAKVQEATFATQRMISVNKLTESEIAGKWALGLFEGDQDKVADARERMLQWNRDNPESPIRINMGQILKRVRAMRMGKEERIAMTAPSEIRATVRRELASEVP